MLETFIIFHWWYLRSRPGPLFFGFGFALKLLLVQFCRSIHFCQSLLSVSFPLALSKASLSAYLTVVFEILHQCLAVVLAPLLAQCCVLQTLCICIIFLTWLTHAFTLWTKNTFWSSLFLMLSMCQRAYLVAVRKIWQDTKHILLVFHPSAALLPESSPRSFVTPPPPLLHLVCI